MSINMEGGGRLKTPKRSPVPQGIHIIVEFITL